MISAKAYDEHVEQLFDVLARVASAFREADIEYRVIGGIAVYLHVAERDQLAARMTRDIDLAVNRCDLNRIAEAVPPHGFALRHVASIDMIVDAAKPSARSAVHDLSIDRCMRTCIGLQTARVKLYLWIDRIKMDRLGKDPSKP